MSSWLNHIILYFSDFNLNFKIIDYLFNFDFANNFIRFTLNEKIYILDNYSNILEYYLIKKIKFTNYFSIYIYLCLFIHKFILQIYIWFFFSMFLILSFFNLMCSDLEQSSFFKKYHDYYIICEKFIFEKLESSEESYLFIRFSFFFIFLFISNIFYFINYDYFIYFIEWNIPVIFGILLIIELLWIISSNFFIYLNGTNTKKFILITFFEDLINFTILVTRILLQLVRGIICSIYHDLLRESNIILIKYLYDIINRDYNIFDHYILIIICNQILYFFSVLFVLSFAVFLMFLQILFLLLAIWLFCKCWFISVLNLNIITIQQFSFINFIKNKKK